jgi:hypothetical protein
LGSKNKNSATEASTARPTIPAIIIKRVLARRPITIFLGVRPEEYHCAGKKQGTNPVFLGKRSKFAD